MTCKLGEDRRWRRVRFVSDVIESPGLVVNSFVEDVPKMRLPWVTCDSAGCTPASILSVLLRFRLTISADGGGMRRSLLNNVEQW